MTLASYETKPASYFANERHEIVDLLETGPADAVLELGCGAGATGRAAMAAGKAGRYVGIELSETAAALARGHITDVLVGDVQAMDLSTLHGQFDALVVSEVLEHLVDPWATLRQLGACLKPGARIYASSPNAAHWHIIRGLLAGRFDYRETGVMDSTHLRWFTPRSYGELVAQAGFEVLEVRPVTPLRSKALLFDRLTGGRLRHLLYTQIMVIGCKSPVSG